MAILAPQKFISKKGNEYTLRSVRADEAEAMNAFMQNAAKETQNTYQVPGISPTLEERKTRLQKNADSRTDITIGVFSQENFVGTIFFFINMPDHPWAKHVGRFGMLILEKHWGEGIGKELLRVMEEFAVGLGVTRIEAEARSFNENGLALYKSMGYLIEGTRRNAAFIDGKYEDEVRIAKMVGALAEKFPRWTPPTLTTERLILRAITLDDAPAMFEYSKSPFDIARMTLWEPHQSIRDTEKMIKEYAFTKYDNREPEPFAVCLKNDPSKIIGTAGARWESKENQCMEMGAALAKEHWGKGIMAEAQSEVMRYCFEEYSRDVSPVNRIQGHCKAENIQSEKMILKTGRKFEAIHPQRVFNKGRFWDMKVFGTIREDWLKTRKTK